MLQLTGLLRRASHADVADAAENDVSAVAEPVAEAGEPARSGFDARATVALMEADIMATLREVVEGAATVHQRVTDKIELVAEAERATGTLSSMAENARGHTQQLAAAIEEMSVSSDEIGRQVQETAKLSERASESAQGAGESIEDLRRSTGEIDDVVRLIASIAKQTNLLALNATIEAARAGEAGRGFAVVANEVKALSVETQKATDEITAKIAHLQETAQASIDAVARITEIIGRLEPVFAAVAASVDQQVTSTAEIGETANKTAAFVATVAERVGEIRGSTTRASELGAGARAACDGMSELIEKLDERFTILLRQSDFGDTRSLDRLPIAIGATIHSHGEAVETTTVDMSQASAMLLPVKGYDPRPGLPIAVDLEGIGRIDGQIVNASQFGLHVLFRNTATPATARLGQRLDDLKDEYRPLITRAQDAAITVAMAIEAAVNSGRLTRDDLFDTDYEPIAGTDPQQFRTRYLAVFEDILPDIQERLLSCDPRMIFCAAVDKNGYLPVHNRIYSQQQRPGDTAWNMANSRNRRHFADRGGLAAARSIRPFLVQSYARDMGNGQVVMMKEVDAPIALFGKHWGAFRMTYRF